VTIDGVPVQFTTETIGHDTYTVFSARDGQHSIVLSKGAPQVQPAAIEIIAPEKQAGAVEPEASPPSLAPNLAPAPTTASPPTEVAAAASPAIGTEYHNAALTPAPAETEPADDSATGVASEHKAQRNFDETRLAILRFISASLIILISLALMVLVAIRRLHGLG
jgi:hypothetical protein